MIKAYYKLETLSDEVKAQNKIKVAAIVPRLDCTLYAGDYQGLEAFKNGKGQMFFYRTPCREVIETNRKRYAEFCLTGSNSLNFGSLYKFTGHPEYAYSYPNKKPFLNRKLPNPLFPFGNDLYILFMSEDYNHIEIFIVEDGRNLAECYLQNLIDGSFDTEIFRLRSEAKPMYNYNGLTF